MKKKAVALFSGGLDSIVAIKVVLEQGIDVVALTFKTQFCRCGGKGCAGHAASKMSDQLGVKTKYVYLAEEYLDIIIKPKHGHGKNINPCLDCRIMMHKKAKEYMDEIGASFIFTGEVLGQRPMSQHKRALSLIDRKSNLEGVILRPLSARLLAPTIAEKEGWINRDVLLNISGRSRKEQMALADKYDIHDYPCPAGGCLLTDPAFSKRIKDLIHHNELTVNNIELLKRSRYFRISPSFKLFVGRNEQENEKLQKLAKKGDLLLQPKTLPGPTAIGVGEFDSSQIDLAAKIVARYTDKDNPVDIEVNIISNHSRSSLVADAISEAGIEKILI
ncbi:MAG: hypothetical protein GY858_02580 [Candidatus Omnitrophica bacterium]|nr:hypothetical protein [Candidatus Omnitrophota bacterium]